MDAIIFIYNRIDFIFLKCQFLLYMHNKTKAELCELENF